MWNITSNDVQQAKDRLASRRAEIEVRYTEEREALDADLAAIETLDRAAAEFALKHNREDLGIAPEPAAVSGPPGDGGASDEDGGIAPEPPATTDPLDGGEGSDGLDILKPGSRWRLHRGDRPSDPLGKTDW